MTLQVGLSGLIALDPYELQHPYTVEHSEEMSWRLENQEQDFTSILCLCPHQKVEGMAWASRPISNG